MLVRYEILIVNKYDNHTRRLYLAQEICSENGRIFLAFLRHCILNYTLNTTIVILWFSKRQKTGSHFIEIEWSTVIKRPRLKRDRDFIQHCKVGASFEKHPTLDGDFSRTPKMERSYTMKILTPRFSMILLERKKEMRAGKNLL